jgi:hypothetical protein
VPRGRLVGRWVVALVVLVLIAVAGYLAFAR